MVSKNEQDKGFFERLGEILNAPLPGAEQGKNTKSDKPAAENEEDTILDRIRDILTQPLPGTNAPEASGKDEQAVIDEEDFSEKWWDHDWELFKAHQDEDRQGAHPGPVGPRSRKRLLQHAVPPGRFGWTSNQIRVKKNDYSRR